MIYTDMAKIDYQASQLSLSTLLLTLQLLLLPRERLLAAQSEKHAQLPLIPAVPEPQIQNWPQVSTSYKFHSS